MEEMKFVYHGSPKKIRGSFLVPHKPSDLGKKKENLKKGVYASHIKDNAIAMAIICAKGVISGSLDFNKRKKGIIYEGWPKQKYFYLYVLPNKNFLRSSKNSSQWVSNKLVKPIKIEKLRIKDYLYLIKKATNKEIKEFYKRYKKELK